MVCQDCESKLSRGAAPDPWKSGSRNNNEEGGRRIGENKALGKSYAAHRHNPYARSACTVCKQPVSQNGGKFCQPCAYGKGVCAICGKQVLDTRFYAMGDGNFGKGRKLHDPKTFHPDGWVPPEGAPAAATEPAAKPKKRSKAAETAGTPSVSAAEPSTTGSGWQLDAASGLYYSVAAQAYYDSSSCMYFVNGEWRSDLSGPGQQAAAAAAPAAAAAGASAGLGASACAEPT